MTTAEFFIPDAIIARYEETKNLHNELVSNFVTDNRIESVYKTADKYIQSDNEWRRFYDCMAYALQISPDEKRMTIQQRSDYKKLLRQSSSAAQKLENLLEKVDTIAKNNGEVCGEDLSISHGLELFKQSGLSSRDSSTRENFKWEIVEGGVLNSFDQKYVPDSIDVVREIERGIQRLLELIENKPDFVFYRSNKASWRDNLRLFADCLSRSPVRLREVDFVKWVNVVSKSKVSRESVKDALRSCGSVLENNL